MIRSYRQQDLAAFVQWLDTAVSPTKLHNILEQAHQNWVLVQDGRPCGFGMVVAIPGLSGLYQLIGAVAPSRRRQGVGSQLLARMMDDLQDTAVKQLSYPVTDITTPAAQFLQKQKFFVEHAERSMTCQLSEIAQQQTNHQLNLTISIVHPGEVIDVLPSLYDQCFAETAWYQPYSRRDIEDTQQEMNQLLLLKEAAKTVGFAWVQYPNSQTAEIEPIGIVPERRGKGYGRFLLNHILQSQKAAGKTAVSLGVWESNHPAIRLYKSLGFRKQSETIYLQCDL
ncbi:MAG: GNAT family N-acetyltransferase [Chloroflexota bacterium]